MFNVSRATHSVVFTSGVTQGLQTLGEHFPWTQRSVFLYADESHTRVFAAISYDCMQTRSMSEAFVWNPGSLSRSGMKRVWECKC